MSPSSAGAWVAPLPVTAGILETSACRLRACAALRVAARGLDQPGRHALLVVEQRLQQMRRRDPLMMLAHGDRLGRLQEAACAIGQFLKVHGSPFCLRGDIGAALRPHKGDCQCCCGCGGVVAAGSGEGGANTTFGPTVDGCRLDDRSERVRCDGDGRHRLADGRDIDRPDDRRAARRRSGRRPSGDTWSCRRGSEGRRRSRGPPNNRCRGGRAPAQSFRISSSRRGRPKRHHVDRRIMLVRAFRRSAGAHVEHRVAIDGDGLDRADGRDDIIVDVAKGLDDVRPLADRRDFERRAPQRCQDVAVRSNLPGRQDARHAPLRRDSR